MDWTKVDDNYIGMLLQALTIYEDCLLGRIEKDKAEGKIKLGDKSPNRLSKECYDFSTLTSEEVVMCWAKAHTLCEGASKEIIRRMQSTTEVIQ